MENKSEKQNVIDVFTDVQVHRLIADLIRKHSTNRSDIRDIALDGLNISECRNILDLGCGFGLFTEILKKRVHPLAVVTGVDVISGYEAPFLETCRSAGFEGKFFSSGAPLIKEFPDRTFDLILCSYALYFFPELIPHVSRVLASNGIFIAIAHDRNNMRELIDITKDILTGNDMLRDGMLPLETIIGQFSSENGLELLSPWFGQIKTIDYYNTLVFQPEDGSQIIKYFLFKSPFLLSGTNFEIEWVVKLLSAQLQKGSFLRDGFTISKNDRIFVCSSPFHS